MKADLHVHSKYSRRPSQWVLQKLGCPESFTDPERLYRIAREKGMSLVTLTDHNTIDGCLEIAHLPDVFVSEEVTTYFPADGCKAHVLVYDITEAIHQDLQKVRENIHELVAYLNANRIVHALAHPLFAVNDRLTIAHFEQFLLLFRLFELNGARHEAQNRHLRFILSRLTAPDIDNLADKHGIAAPFEQPWRKYLTGGSDDHSSLTIARQYTEIEGVSNPREFLRALESEGVRIVGQPSTAKTMAHNLYGIAYQFYRNKFDLERHVTKDIFVRFLDRFLQGESSEKSLLGRFHALWNHRKRPREQGPAPQKVQEVLRHETLKLLWDDPELMEMVKNGNGNGNGMSLDTKWFEFVNQLSNKVLSHFGNHILDHVSGANLFKLFHSLGSAGALYAVLAPYFVAFSMFSREKQLSEQILERFTPGRPLGGEEDGKVKVAHFTDTYYQVNGVALTLQRQVELALRTRKDLTVITCNDGFRPAGKGVRNFSPIGVHELPEYPEFKLFVPPFLEMLDYCYEQSFTQLHSATPGPIGLAALAIARILKRPISGTYHTALPQYAQYLTGDTKMEDLVRQFTLWYYEQMDHVYVPSRSTARELLEQGLRPEKIRLFPRGVDIQRFHPAKRDLQFLRERFQVGDGMKLLYVGRISKEKDLPLLADAFHELYRSHREVQLIMVGDGPYLTELREKMREVPCTFTGYLEGEDLARVFASCDLFVFPSTTDTFGNVVLEAQASGLPVVVTDAGGPHENIVPGVTGIDLEVARGEFVALIGASGSGKSTLLRHLSGFLAADSDPPSQITVLGHRVQQHGQIVRDVRAVRAGIGFIFQQFNLVGRLPLITNVLTGMLFRIPWWRSLPGWFSRKELAEGFTALAKVGMAGYAWQRTSTLSGGQQQRAAIARCLAQQADIILADEPIASLDPESARNVMEILAAINREQGVTVLVSLHQVDMALRYCPRAVALHQGRLIYDGPSTDLTPALLRELYGAAADEILHPDAACNPPSIQPRLVPRVAEALG